MTTSMKAISMMTIMQQSNRKRERERQMMIMAMTKKKSNRVRDDNEDELTMMTLTHLSRTEYSAQK